MVYLNYRLKARHRKGRGIHPPFAYEMVSAVIYGRDPEVPDLSRIEAYRRELFRDQRTVTVEDYGAGSRMRWNTERTIRGLARHTAVPPRRGRLLARLVGHLLPEVTIELGTGTGISTLYLAMANPSGRVLSCEGSNAIAELAEEGFAKLGLDNIRVYRGLFSDLLPELLELSGSGLFVFIDGDHREESLISYVTRVLASGRRELVLVMDDIHWSRGMYRAWKKIIGMSAVSLSIELFNTGIVFVKEKVQKDHFVVIF
jgi:predicted O-methyltransferase YrrM